MDSCYSSLVLGAPAVTGAVAGVAKVPEVAMAEPTPEKATFSGVFQWVWPVFGGKGLSERPRKHVRQHVAPKQLVAVALVRASVVAVAEGVAKT